MKPNLFLGLLLTFVFVSVNANFKAYWNVAINKCINKYDIVPDLDYYGIIHNENIEFNGKSVNIYYKPGMFPTILTDNSTINGGIPPLGDLRLHKDTFYEQLATELKDAKNGPLVLNFESYRPRYQSAPQSYRDTTLDYVRELYPSLSKFKTKQEAETMFNTTVKSYFKSLLNIARNERPNTLVGYYHYPYCNNLEAPFDTCSSTVTELNDDLRKWLFPKMTALYPSLYNKKDTHAGDLRYNFLTTVMREAVRVNDLGVPILPYVNPLQEFYTHLIYTDRYKGSDKYMSKDILLATFWIIKYFGGDGAVLWASSTRFQTAEDCERLQIKVNNRIGPILECMDLLPNSVVQSLKTDFPLPTKAGGPDNWDNLKQTVDILDFICF